MDSHLLLTQLYHTASRTEYNLAIQLNKYSHTPDMAMCCSLFVLLTHLITSLFSTQYSNMCGSCTERTHTPITITLGICIVLTLWYCSFSNIEFVYKSVSV